MRQGTMSAGTAAATNLYQEHKGWHRQRDSRWRSCTDWNFDFWQFGEVKKQTFTKTKQNFVQFLWF